MHGNMSLKFMMSSPYFEPRVHLQEDGCIYSYGTACCTCISIKQSNMLNIVFGTYCKAAYTDGM